MMPLAAVTANRHPPWCKLLINKGKPLARWRFRCAIVCVLLCFCISAGFAEESAVKVKVGYLRTAEQKITISLIEESPPNDGLADAQLADVRHRCATVQRAFPMGFRTKAADPTAP